MSMMQQPRDLVVALPILSINWHLTAI